MLNDRGHHSLSAINMKNSLRLIFPAFLVVCTPPARAATINAASVSQADVAAAITSAANGDTVVMPAGSATWTTGLDIRKAITLKGAGIGATIITSDLPGSSGSNFISWGLLANKTSRMTGIEIKDTVGRGAYTVAIFGRNNNGSKMRIDHCKFNGLRTPAILSANALGVIDNNVFLPAGNAIPIQFQNATWNMTGGIMLAAKCSG